MIETFKYGVFAVIFLGIAALVCCVVGYILYSMALSLKFNLTSWNPTLNNAIRGTPTVADHIFLGTMFWVVTLIVLGLYILGLIAREIHILM